MTQTQESPLAVYLNKAKKQTDIDARFNFQRYGLVNHFGSMPEGAFYKQPNQEDVRQLIAGVLEQIEAHQCFVPTGTEARNYNSQTLADGTLKTKVERMIALTVHDVLRDYAGKHPEARDIIRPLTNFGYDRLTRIAQSPWITEDLTERIAA